jgi:hypothetical protein
MSSTPYLDRLLSTLENIKELVRLHEEKIKIASIEPFDRLAYDNVEIKISCLKSEGEINTLKRVLSEKEDYFKDYYANWEKDSLEMDNNFNDVFSKCIELSKTNENLKSALSKIDMSKIEDNREARVYVYRRLKGLL